MQYNTHTNLDLNELKLPIFLNIAYLTAKLAVPDTEYTIGISNIPPKIEGISRGISFLKEHVPSPIIETLPLYNIIQYHLLIFFDFHTFSRRTIPNLAHLPTTGTRRDIISLGFPGMAKSLFCVHGKVGLISYTICKVWPYFT